MARRKRAPKKFASEPVGECIYCGSTEARLTDEHIIPAGLNGTWVVPAASCSACAATISRAELLVQRGALLSPRASLGLFTRNPDDRPMTLPLTVNGVPVDVPASEYPGFLTLLEFEPPGFWSGKLCPPGVVRVRGFATRLDRERLERLARQALGEAEAGEVSVSWSVEFSTEELEALQRVLAKIAYCAVVAQQGRRAVRSTYLQDVILGNNPFSAHFVGTVPMETPLSALPVAVTRFEVSPESDKPTEFHRVTTHRSKGMWHAYVQLFRGFYGGDAPIHHVVVGEVA